MDSRPKSLARLFMYLIVIFCAAAILMALDGCAADRVMYYPIPDPMDGQIYPCCWYPHGFYMRVPDGQRPPIFDRLTPGEILHGKHG